MRHKLPKFTLFVLWQVIQVPVVYYFHNHDLTNAYYWELYRNVFSAFRAVDVILAFVALNEMMCTPFQWISKTLELWVMAQVVLFKVAGVHPEYWAFGEAISNGIYLISQVLWVRILAVEPPHDE